MKVNNFFPLSILQDQIRLSNEEKDNLINDIREMKKNSKNKNYKLNQASWTGDTQGYEYIYNNPRFNNLFIEIICLTTADLIFCERTVATSVNNQYPKLTQCMPIHDNIFAPGVLLASLCIFWSLISLNKHRVLENIALT